MSYVVTATRLQMGGCYELGVVPLSLEDGALEEVSP